MDILNNIWTAISTPNEKLVTFICFLLLFIEAPLSFSLIKNIFNIKCIKKQKIIYVLTTAIVAILATLFTNFPYNIILNYVTAFIILYLRQHIWNMP